MFSLYCVWILLRSVNISFIFLFFVSFPFDLWIKSSFYLYLAETLARLIFVVFLLMYNHFKKLYFTKLAEYYKKDIIKSLKLKPNQTFLVNKYKMQAKYFKTKELKEILQDLRDLDYQYKNGIIDLQIGLEAILCKYCS